MSVEHFEFNQAEAIEKLIPNGVSDGVCWELCRRFIKGRMTQSWEFRNSLHALSGTTNSFQSLNYYHTIHKEGIKAGDMAGRAPQAPLGDRLSKQEPDTPDDHHSNISASRVSSRFRFTGLRTRNDVINHVMTVRGLYIYQFTGRGKNTGHAVAFDTRSDPICFLDANYGEYLFRGEGLEFMRQWWSTFWENTYKRKVHGGSRYLVLYLSGP